MGALAEKLTGAAAALGSTGAGTGALTLGKAEATWNGV
jgi:hypothetical protein